MVLSRSIPLNLHPLDAASTMDYSTIKFSPAIPFPAPFDVQRRIQQLRSFLDPNHPNYQREEQHINIKAAIQLYEDGKIDGIEEVFIKDGKIVSREEVFKGGWSIREGRLCQLAQKHAYNHGPFDLGFHEVSMKILLLFCIKFLRFVCYFD